MVTEEELKKQLDQATWEDLLPHYQRGGVVIVTEDMDLVQVGMAVVEDQVQQVQQWLAAEMVYKAEEYHVKKWPKEKMFKFIIVQPYVLIQNSPN